MEIKLGAASTRAAAIQNRLGLEVVGCNSKSFELGCEQRELNQRMNPTRFSVPAAQIQAQTNVSSRRPGCSGFGIQPLRFKHAMLISSCSGSGCNDLEVQPLKLKVGRFWIPAVHIQAQAMCGSSRSDSSLDDFQSQPRRSKLKRIRDCASTQAVALIQYFWCRSP